MINPKCHTTEWIDSLSRQFSYPDKNLIEKVVRAMSLLDMLARSGCPFIFKGGSCLMLLLKDSAHRLSIDIDILCPPGTNIEDYLKDYAANGFLNYQLVERRQAGTDVPKSHSKFFYQVAFRGESSETSYILLDVLYEDCQYQQMQQVSVESPFISIDGAPTVVTVPSIGDILGDKLTAFAPDTTGIPYFKKEKLSTLEIIKQLYDIGRLFDHVNDFTVAASVFCKIAPIELGYRGMPATDLNLVFEDIRNTALNLALRGQIDKEKFALLQQGIKRIDSFMYQRSYHIEQAITDAAKAAYLATMVQYGITEVRHFDGTLLSIAEKQINLLPNRLNRLKLPNAEAFYYWYLTEEILIHHQK